MAFTGNPSANMRGYTLGSIMLIDTRSTRRIEEMNAIRLRKKADALAGAR